MTQEHSAHPAREHRWITTFSGERIKSTAVHASQINKADMVRGLAMQVRYLGQISAFYSIAEHSVLVAKISAAYGDPIEVQRAALLHDGHEYLTGDFPSPFKYDVEGLREWERRIEATFRQAMGLPPNDDPIWEKVKRYDLIALHFEASQLMSQNPGWIDPDMLAAVPLVVCLEGVIGMQWGSAAQYFCRWARALGLEDFTW